MQHELSRLHRRNLWGVFLLSSIVATGSVQAQIAETDVQDTPTGNPNSTDSNAATPSVPSSSDAQKSTDDTPSGVKDEGLPNTPDQSAELKTPDEAESSAEFAPSATPDGSPEIKSKNNAPQPKKEGTPPAEEIGSPAVNGTSTEQNGGLDSKFDEPKPLATPDDVGKDEDSANSREPAGSKNLVAAPKIAPEGKRSDGNPPLDTREGWVRNLEGPGLLRFRFGAFEVQAPVLLHGVGEAFSDVAVAPNDKQLPAAFGVDPMLRLGLKVTATDLFFPGFRIVGEYEQDLHLESHFALSDADIQNKLAGEGLPRQNHFDLYDLRKALVRVHVGPAFFASVGVTAPHWGLGLVSNDGAHDWTPGSARFTHPHHGDRVLRAAIGTGPWTELGFAGTLFADYVLDDDVMLLDREYADVEKAANDQAWQGGGAVFFGRGKPYGAGIYGVLRSQNTADGRTLLAGIGDLTAHYEQKFFKFIDVKVEGEVTFIAGSTDFSPNLNYEEQLVLQYGGVLRASAGTGLFGAVVDFVYASGDQNYDDNMQNSFRMDQNFDLGMVLYKQVMAAQTGHAVATAGDPNLVGAAATGLERFPTRGAVTNTIAVFPRLWVRPFGGLFPSSSDLGLDGLEVYGGPLLAFSEVPLADPLRSRAAGGAPRNALGGGQSTFLGTELDLGLRYPMQVFSVQLNLGAEGAVFIPGPALNGANDDAMNLVYGGRVLFEVKL